MRHDRGGLWIATLAWHDARLMSTRRKPGQAAVETASRLLPERAQAWARHRARRVWPPVGWVRFGSLRRLRPIGEDMGTHRGTPLDRYYIEGFLDRHAGRAGYVQGDIRGRVLEVGDDMYTRRFGVFYDGPEESAPEAYVTSVDVLHADTSNPNATIVGDLATGQGIPEEAYDCVICTQTLQVIYDVRGAIRSLHRMLKPGGVALVTMSGGILQLCRPDYDLWGDYWRFTSLSARRLFEEVFPPECVTVEAHGNVLVGAALLYGLAVEDLRRHELDAHDPNYEVTIAVRASKPAAAA
jgi:SAM-dependent methyltransferase